MKSIRKFVFIMVALAALLSSCSTDAGDSKIPSNEAGGNAVKQLTIGATSDKVTLAWMNPPAPYYGVKISMTPAEGDLAEPKTYSTETTNALISGLREQTKYTFTFTSIDADGKDTLQSVSIATTTSAQFNRDPSSEDTIPPGDVTELEVTATASSISVKWTDATDSDIFGYIAVCTGKSNSAGRSALVPLEKGSIFVLPGVQKCEFTDIKDGKTYTVTVKTMDTSGNLSKGVPTDVTTQSEDVAPIPFGSRTENLNFIFGTESVAEIVLTIDSSEWNTMLDYYDLNERNEECVHADFKMKKGGYTWTIDDIGIRPRGNTSRVRPQWGEDYYQSHFKIDFEEWLSDDDTERKLAGCMKGLILKRFKDDPTYSREVFGYNFFRDNGIWTSPRAGYAHLVINITEKNGKTTKIDYGVYAMIEEIKKQFLKERSDSAGGKFKNNKGNLWKCCWQSYNGPSMTKDYDIYRSFGVEDISLFEGTSRRYDYDLKTNKDDLKAARDEFISFIDDLNKPRTEADTKAWFESKMDVDLFLKTYACNVLLGMDDDYWCNKNNYYFYFDTSKKAYFIPYDYDNILGTNIKSDSAVRNPLDWGEDNDAPLINRLLSVSEFKEKYMSYLLELSDDGKSGFVSKSQEKITKWQNMIKPYLSNSSSDYDKRASVAYDTIGDDTALWCSNSGKYKLLSGDDSTNYFKAKAKSVQTYCKPTYTTLTFKFDGPDGKNAVFLDRFGMPCQNPYIVEDAIMGTRVSKYIAFETCQAVFTGWFDAAEGGNEVVFVSESGATLYAHWYPFPYTYSSNGTTEYLTFTFNPADFYDVYIDNNSTVVAACELNGWKANGPIGIMTQEADGTYTYTYDSETYGKISSMWPGYKFVVDGTTWFGYDRYKYQLPEEYAERSGNYNFLIPEFK